MRILFVLALLACDASAAEHAILVLGSTVKPNGRPSAGLTRRLEVARLLAVRDPRAVVVVSGGTRGGRWKPEGEVMSRWLVAHGIPSARIRVEAASTNTAENADFTAPILQREHVSLVTVVTEQFHLRRALFHVHAALGETMHIDGAPAPDGLDAAARVKMDAQETQKLARDRAFREAR
ncbi:MAG: YdcF family protein [Polyangia bacterium]